MKILHIVRQFFPAIGGIENYVLHLASQQVKQGHTVKIVTLNRNFADDKKLKPFETLPPGIEIIRIPFFFSKKYPLAFRVIRYLKGSDIITVHAVDFFADFLALTKVFHRKKMILITHGGFFHTAWGSILKKIYFHTVTRLLIRSYDAVIGCSENDINIFKQICPSILLIHNGVNTEPYLKTKKAFVNYELLYVGRVDVHKGVDKLIRLVRILRDEGFPVHLNIAGPDWKKLQPSLEKLAVDLDVSKVISFKGAVSDEELQRVYSTAHIFLSASAYEGFGISAVEAMASGTLCALNNIESFRKLLLGKSFGVICDFNNLEDTANKISALLKLPESEYHNFSNDAREYSKNFSWEHIVTKIEKIYKEVLTDLR